MTPSSAAYSPSYRLAINGFDLPESVRSYITSIRYEDGRDGSDQVTIALANPDLTFLTTHIRGLTVVPPTGISVEHVPPGRLGRLELLRHGQPGGPGAGV